MTKYRNNRLRLKSLFTTLGLAGGMLLPGVSLAQCPVAAACTPSNPAATNLAFGMGIRNVTLNTLNNNTSANATGGTQNGYQDFSCTIGTNLTASVNYPVSITSGPSVAENVRVYIDLNNDGVFTVPAEQVFSSNNAQVHTGSISIPATAVMGTRLRMRVVSEFTGATVLPGPCTALEFGQVEDYFVQVSPNTNPAAPDFTTTELATCDGTVDFLDASQNGATSWTWSFGDPASGAANESNAQNPSHTFSAPGTYTISLTSCNAIGCSTITKNNYITYFGSVPVAASCAPATVSYCCGYGINRVTFAGIDNPSADGVAGYQDFTCPVRGTVTEGLTYPVSILTGTANPHDTYLWIDLNNDGAFSTAERLFASLNSTNPTGTVQIPGGTVLNTPLRMRVISDFAGATVTACASLTHGQAEDYTITVLPNTNPPIANFTVGQLNQCDSVRVFTSTTTENPGSPTTYTWHFGTGDSSNLANPTYNYGSTNGQYTVTLVACNAFGCDTLVQTNAVTISFPCVTYCPSSGHTNTSQWISRVNLGTIQNQSGAGANGYTDFTSINTTLVRGSTTNPLTILLGANLSRNIAVWIDLNIDGVFTTNERVFLGTAFNQGAGIGYGVNGNIIVPAGTQTGITRMRVLMRNTSVNNDPCIMNQNNADVEDYSVVLVQPPVVPPVAQFSADQSGICAGTVVFQDASTNNPTSWTWNFGDGSAVSNLQNPTHTYQTTTPANYTVTLTSCNSGGCNTVTIPNYVVITVPCTPVYCPSEGHTNTNQWITRVDVGTISNTSQAAPNGYSNFTAFSSPLTIGGDAQASVRLANGSSSWNLAIWIDFDRNGTFETTERVVNGFATTIPGGGFGLNGNFTIPATATPGTTRMRVIGRNGTNNSPCVMNLTSGETEDYTVNLSSTVTTDIGITAVTGPVSGCNPGAAAQLCVWVKNYGTASQSNIPVRAQVNNGPAINANVTGPVAGGDSVQFCFPTTINLSNPGSYTIVVTSLLFSDAVSANNSQTVTVNSLATPSVTITHTANGTAVAYMASGTGATSWSWDFGDGNGSTAQNPNHNYATFGNYTVTLTATAANGCSTVTSQVISVVSGLQDLAVRALEIYPNPNKGTFSIALPAAQLTELQISRMLGQVVHRQKIDAGAENLEVNLDKLTPGVYQAVLASDKGIYIARLVIQ